MNVKAMDSSFSSLKKKKKKSKRTKEELPTTTRRNHQTFIYEHIPFNSFKSVPHRNLFKYYE